MKLVDHEKTRLLSNRLIIAFNENTEIDAYSVYLAELEDALTDLEDAVGRVKGMIAITKDSLIYKMEKNKLSNNSI